MLRFWKVGRKDGSAGEEREDRQKERLHRFGRLTKVECYVERMREV